MAHELLITPELLHLHGWQSRVNFDLEPYWQFNDIMLLHDEDNDSWGISGYHETVFSWDQLLNLYKKITGFEFIAGPPIPKGYEYLLDEPDGKIFKAHFSDGPPVFTFTFVVEFRGGTYCSQVEATDEAVAVTLWLQKFKASKTEIKHLTDKAVKELEFLIEEKDNLPQPLTGLYHVWYTLFTTSAGAFHISIVKTAL